MSEHRPECPPTEPFPCICDRLRQAEQRGHKQAESIWRAYLLADDENSNAAAYRQGYADALNAAREAVAGLPVHKPNVLITLLDYEDVLAAIDALHARAIAADLTRDGQDMA